MPSPAPQISVVFATHDRADRLRALLASLRRQEVDVPFEVVVVDDASTDGTSGVLEEAVRAGDLDLHPVRLDLNRGPAAARNVGWRVARGTVVAFTDDDCTVTPGWLAAGLRALDRRDLRVVQGRTEPEPTELDREGPFSRTLRVRSLGPHFQTCNIFYPRDLLEAVGGFDEETFSVPGGEDSDLARRCIAAGADAVFAPDALAHHAVHQLGPVGKLRVAWRWTETMRLYARHPEMRETLTYGIFWKKSHYILVRAALGLVLPRRARLLRAWCLAPIAPSYLERARTEGHGRLWSAPWFLLHDLVELVAAVRGAVRYRTWVV